VTLSDLDLETRLRDQRTRAEEIAPPPVDLAQRVRQRAREQRRRRAVLTAAGVTAALVFVGLPALASGLVGEGSRGESAAPSSQRPSVTTVPALDDLPTRGSLAGDEGWLREIAALSWRSADLEGDSIEGVVLHDPPLDTRHVAFAGDVPGGRVALVLGLDSRLVHAWFVGPEGADPEDMTLAVIPSESTQRQPLALWTRPDPDSDDAVLVVVGNPGDEVDVLTGRDVTAAAETRELWEAIPMEDGVGALLLERAFSWPLGAEFRVQRGGQREPLYPALEFSDELLADAQAPVEVADPRGLLSAVDADELQWAVQYLVSHYGLSAERLRPTLLAAGPIGAGSSTSALLVGVTFPSGATTALVGTYWGHNDSAQGMSSMTLLTGPAPAGTGLLDRVLAVATANALIVSGPSTGVLVELYLADGTPFTTLPLVGGVGIGPLPPPATPPSRDAEPGKVRILDAKGSFVAESPVERVG
jgi:hypothetical protein